jgi:uncharacterized protein (TIGR03086 family)
MSEVSDRYRKVAGNFTARVDAVPADKWDAPAPCEGWVARDVVRHVVEWMPAMFFGGAGLDVPKMPSVDDDPVAAWHALDRALGGGLDDPEIASRVVESQAGSHRFDVAVDTFGTPDLLVHTWDLARATGLDETLDADEVHKLFLAMEPLDEMLRASGQFGPRVDVPATASEQDKLIAFSGRHP